MGQAGLFNDRRCGQTLTRRLRSFDGLQEERSHCVLREGITAYQVSSSCLRTTNKPRAAQGVRAPDTPRPRLFFSPATVYHKLGSAAQKSREAARQNIREPLNLSVLRRGSTGIPDPSDFRPQHGASTILLRLQIPGGSGIPLILQGDNKPVVQRVARRKPARFVTGCSAEETRLACVHYPWGNPTYKCPPPPHTHLARGSQIPSNDGPWW